MRIHNQYKTKTVSFRSQLHGNQLAVFNASTSVRGRSEGIAPRCLLRVSEAGYTHTLTQTHPHARQVRSCA